MVFTSFSFLIFLAATTLVYYIVPMRQYRDRLPSGKRINTPRHNNSLHPRGFVLLLASLVFYCFAGWEKLPFVAGTALAAWLCSRKMGGLDAELKRMEEIPENGDLISRSALLAAYDAEHVGPPGRARTLIAEAHAVNAEPVKIGDWIYDPNGMDWNLPAWRCSECHGRNDNLPADTENKRVIYNWAGHRYCPNCGAKMEMRDD